jgi:hypothetical protein
MPWQSSGNFNRLYSWVSDAAAGFDILADRMDADTNDITQGLMRTVNLDGLTSPSANLPMGGFKHTNVAQATNPTDYARFDQIIANTGNQTVNGNLTTTGTLTVAGGTALNGGVTVTGGGSVSGNWSVGQNLTVGNYAQLPQTLITGPATLNSTLTVAGGTTLNGAAALNGGATVSGGATIDQLTVTGPAGVGGNLNVNGAASVAGGLTSGGLTVNGGATVNGPLATTTNRIISAGNNAPSLTVFNTTAGVGSGMWVGTSGLNFGAMDGSGNPTAAWGFFDASANLNLDYGLIATGYAQLNGGLRVQGGDLNVYGNAYKPGGGTWGDNSDVRLKKNIVDYPAGLSAIRRLRPVSYRFNGRGDTTADGQTYYGLVAQEVVDVMPEMVGQRPTERRGDPVRAYYTLDATPLIYAMVNALKEVVRRLEALEGVRGESDADAAAPAGRPGTANF